MCGLRAVLVITCAGCSFRPGVLASAGAATDATAAIDAAPDAAPPPAFCDPAGGTLVACYQLEGSAHDGSPNHLDATMTNVEFVPGRVGSAAMLDATSAMDVADSAALDVPALTIEAWLDPSQIPATGRAGIVDNQGQWGFFLHPNGDLKCTANVALQVAAAVQPNVWTHVACTYDGATVRIYANGALVGSLGGGGALSTAGTTGISIGADNPPGSGSPQLGLIDQLRIFSVARSDAELAADAAAPVTL